MENNCFDNNSKCSLSSFKEWEETKAGVAPYRTLLVKDEHGDPNQKPIKIKSEFVPKIDLCYIKLNKEDDNKKTTPIKREIKVEREDDLDILEREWGEALNVFIKGPQCPIPIEEPDDNTADYTKKEPVDQREIETSTNLKFTQPGNSRKRARECGPSYGGSVKRHSSASSSGSSRDDIGDKRKLVKVEEEKDPRILARRQKQIDYGKNTIGYENYIQAIPRSQRKREHPKTPPKVVKYSRRGWDGLVKIWRQQLHFWDPESDENDCESDVEDLI